MNRYNAILITFTLTAISLGASAAGYFELQVADPDYKPLQVGVWYPTDKPPPSLPNTEYELAVALDAPTASINGGLIVISHGYSGWYGGHADTAIALADAGYVVAAPSHAGNTWSDMSASVAEWIIHRPRQISRVIDAVTEHAAFADHIDAAHIGVYGFSAGGYTALGLIGGVPDLDHAQRHCKTQPSEFVCAEGLIDAMFSTGLQTLPPKAWGVDSRISAVVISAPALAFAYTKDSLKHVNADLQLWSGELDESVPTQTNAALLAKRLPTPPETHWIDKAGHFAFMTVSCRDSFKKADPEEYEIICGDQDGFDRKQFHQQMHIEMIRFFNESFEITQ